MSVTCSNVRACREVCRRLSTPREAPGACPEASRLQGREASRLERREASRLERPEASRLEGREASRLEGREASTSRLEGRIA